MNKVLVFPLCVLIVLVASSCAAPDRGPAEAALGAMRWLDTGIRTGSNCILTTLSGKVAYFDPVDIELREGKAWPKADYIFITHSHQDHYSVGTVLALSKEDTRVFAPGDLAYKLEDAGIANVVTAVPPGSETPGFSEGRFPGTAGKGEIAVKTLPMYTLGDESSHPRIMEWVGYVVEAEGVVLWVSGDTGPVPEAKALRGVDIAVVALTDGYSVTYQEAAGLMGDVRPKYFVPSHWNGDYEAAGAKLRDLMPAGTRCVILDLE